MKHLAAIFWLLAAIPLLAQTKQANAKLNNLEPEARDSLETLGMVSDDGTNLSNAIEADPAAVRASLSDVAITGSVTLTSPVQYSGHSSSLPVLLSGTYTVSTGALAKAQWQFGNDPTWRDVDAFAASGGSWSGSASLPAGSGTLTIRLNESAVTTTVTNLAVGKVIAVAGQSNARGAATSGQGGGYTGLLGSTMYIESAANTWSWAAPTVNTNYHASDIESVWVDVANVLEPELGEPVIFVIGDCDGGTGFYDNSWEDGGTNYEQTVSAWNASGVRKIDVVIWDQGEDDAVQDMATATYKANVEDMWTDMRSEVSALADAHMLCALISAASSGSTNVGQHYVREAVIQLADDPSNRISVGAGRHAGMGDWNYTQDPVHPKSTLDMEWLSRKWARVLYSHFKGGVAGRGPRLDTSNLRLAAYSGVADDTIELEFLGDLPMTLPESTGWEFTDTVTGALTISTVEVIDRGLKFTLSPDPAGTVTMSFGKLYSSLQSRTGDSGHLIALPPEPILDYELGTTYPTDLLVGLVAAWDLDEASGSRADDSGNGHTMSESGTVGSDTGNAGTYAAELDGTNYLTATQFSAELHDGFTLSFWINNNAQTPSGTTNLCHVLSAGTSLGSGGPIDVWIDYRRRVYARINGSGNDSPGVRTADNAIGANSAATDWVHVLFVWSGDGTVGASADTVAAAELDLYINGVNVGIANSAGTDTWVAIDAGTNPMQIGRITGGSAAGTLLVGQMALWNRPLNATEREYLYTSPGLLYAGFSSP